MDTIYDRTEIVLGKENIEKIKKLHICICGIGGVGSFVFESLVRLGVKQITVIDKDKVDLTNINRQLIALSSNVGMPKVECAVKRAREINPDVKINIVHDYISVDNVDKYITKDTNYVIDAIDTVDSKISIIKKCKTENIPLISSMGMANRLDPLKIKISYIEKTTMCPLAKRIRKILREENISKVKVVYSDEEPIKTDSDKLGSIPYVPGIAGLIIVSEIIKDIIKEG